MGRGGTRAVGAWFLIPINVGYSSGMPHARMPKYSVSYRTHGGHIFSHLEFEAPHDKAAIAKAQALDVPSIGAGYDVRQGERMVISVVRRCH